MRTVHYELLRPSEILAAREQCPLAYVPVSPLEWHAPHLPMGTDALHAGAIAEQLALRTGGVVLPTFYWGTERERPPEVARDLGFDEGDYIVGMDFPANSLSSLYCREEFLALLVRELVGLLVRQGFEFVGLVNAHGAVNQVGTLRRLCVELTAASPAHVFLIQGWPPNGGHADLTETAIMLALHPESVAVGELPPLPEPLDNRRWAIVDADTFAGRPAPDYTVRPEADPRHASAEMGHSMFEGTVAECEHAVRTLLAAAGYRFNEAGKGGRPVNDRLMTT